jgi:predicted phosphoribosyltransferase
MPNISLIDCVDVDGVRQTFYNVNNLYNIFTNVADDTIVKFLKEINWSTDIDIIFNKIALFQIYIYLLNHVIILALDRGWINVMWPEHN